MKILKTIITWYLIGIVFASLFVGSIIMIQIINHSHIAPGAMGRLAPVVFVLSGFFGLVAYAAFGKDHN